MADMTAEDAFLKSLKDKADAEEAVQYEAGGAEGKQTESTSSDEYDPAQAVPDAFSPHPPQDNLFSLGVVNQPSYIRTSDLPSNPSGNVAATGPPDQAVDEDDGRSQSRSMSGSSSSSSPVNIHSSNVPFRVEVDTPAAAIAEENADSQIPFDSVGTSDQAPQTAAISSLDLTSSAITEKPQPQNDSSIEKLPSVVSNGVSHSVPESSTPLPESRLEGQAEILADGAPVHPVLDASETKSTTTDLIQSIAASAPPKARLPNDKIGILEDRTQADPRGDMDAWLELISEYQKRNKVQEARNTYERFFLVFPAAAAQWVAYARMENDLHNLNAKEKIFQRVLLTLPNLQLWSSYLDHIRRRNNIETDSTGEARKVITQAYEVALTNIGLDKDSGYLWQEYIQFVKSRPGNAGGSSWQEQQKMDQLRAAYQRAIKVPTQATQSLWKEYDQFEMGINKTTGRGFLQKESPAYMTARSSYTELSNITRNLRRTTLAKLPPALGFDGDQEYGEQLEIWKKWIQWEKDDPLVLKDGSEEERKQWRARVVFVYKQAVMDMRFWPEMWYDAAEFCFQNELDQDGNEFLIQGIYANPESCLLAFRKADRIELTTSNGDGSEGIIRRGAAVREPYDQVLDALYELITITKARETQDVARIEAQFVTNEEKLPNGNNNEDNEDEDHDETNSKEKQKAAQIEAVKGITAMQIRVLTKTITFVWIALMRAMRRVQGKGKNQDKIGGSRQIFNDARRRGRLTHDIYVASAMIEYHCYDPEATKKIFERGLKLFPEDEIFALEYIKHLTLTNDHTNARVIFETVVNKLTSKAEGVPRAKPLYAFFHDFESKYGELTQIVKLEKRMSEHFPDDPSLSHFSRRFVQPGFDPTAIRPIISPATQTRRKPIHIAEPSLLRQGSPSSPNGQRPNSPKRPLPLEDSDTDAERPRKVARGESPLKGAAGRRLEQQKRSNQPQGNSQYEQALPQPPPASLPPAIMHVLGDLPRASHYPLHPRFIPHKVVEHVQKMNLETARRVQPPGSSQQRAPPPIPSRLPHQMPQPLAQYPPSIPPVPPTGMPNPYNGGYPHFPPHTHPPSPYPQQHEVPAPPGNQHFPGPIGQTIGYGGAGYPYGQAKQPQSLQTQNTPPRFRPSLKMAGASKQRAKKAREAALGKGKAGDNNGQGNVGHYDGPSDRPGSSSGPPRPGSSHGGPPSNAPQPGPPSNAPGQSARSSSRPRSAAGPPSASAAPLRDPARDHPRESQKTLPSRVDWGGGLYSYYSNEPVSECLDIRNSLIDIFILHLFGPQSVPSQLMRRPGYGKEGRQIKLRLNSHHIINSPNARYYQYSVQIGKDLKRALIKAIWDSQQLQDTIPGGIREWLYDGNTLAWSKQDLKTEFHTMIDLDKERGRDITRIANEKRDIYRVHIKKSAHIDLNNIYAYLDGQVDFGPGVIDAINFLDHLIREWPSKQHINIKKSYFDRTAGQKQNVGGGVEAMRGIYQSIRMAEGKRMVVNVDVSHTCFWNKSSFPMIINQLSGHMDIESLPHSWRDRKTGKTNAKFTTMKRLKKNDFFVTHRGRSEREASRVWKVGDILPQSSREFTFKPFLKAENKEGGEINLFQYYQKKYNVYLQWPDLPVVQCTRKKIVYPMELCTMMPGQRYPYKLNEQQTSQMIKFAVQPPDQRLASIQAGTRMLGWDNDPVLKHYGLRINPEPINTDARILNPPVLQFDKSTVTPGTKGKWDLRGKRFLVPNEAPLRVWGVAVLTDPSSAQRGGTPNQAQVTAFVQSFISSYKGHGGIVENTSPLINGPQSDAAKCAELLFYGVGNKHNARPQLLIFILPNTSTENYLRIKKSCDCRYGSFTQCVQGAQVIKNNPQYHSNVLMKVNAKLGGTTNRIATKSPSGHFTRPTMIIGADVSHAAPGIGAPSYAAMTVSMDKYAARYAAGVQTNGFRVEMISTRNLRDMLTPLFRHWTANVSGGRLPDQVYYFRDGVSEGQYLNVIKYEVADIKEIWNEMVVPKPGVAPHQVKFTVVVAEKRHHIRFFPGKAGDDNQNPLPGTIVEHDVTHPMENDIYLCSHKALKGTARPTHYHMLLDEAKINVDAFQKLLYENCYQYMRSTTPVSLFPAVYYAHLASNRARAHEDIAESDRRIRDAGDPSRSTSGRPVEEAAPLLPMIPRDGLPWGMWYI
ncbi:MAG: hypothetical protein Q9166_006395 [cf. Caloplaca sp. 2 TL-2023]